MKISRNMCITPSYNDRCTSHEPGCLHWRQHAYRLGKSTWTSLGSRVSLIEGSLDNKKMGSFAFMGIDDLLPKIENLSCPAQAYIHAWSCNNQSGETQRIILKLVQEAIKEWWINLQKPCLSFLRKKYAYYTYSSPVTGETRLIFLKKWNTKGTTVWVSTQLKFV